MQKRRLKIIFLKATRKGRKIKVFGEMKMSLLCQGVRCILKSRTPKPLGSSEGRKKKEVLLNIRLWTILQGDNPSFESH